MSLFLLVSHVLSLLSFLFCLIYSVMFLSFHPTPLFLFFGLLMPLHHHHHHQRALWSHLFPRLSSRVTPLSCTVTWWETPPQKSSGGTLRSIAQIPSGSCGMVPVSGESPSARLMAPTVWVCWVSLVSCWTMLGPTSAERAMTRGETTSTKIQPPPGSVLRPL